MSVCLGWPGLIQGQELKLGITFTPTIGFGATDNEDVENDGTNLGLVYGIVADYIFNDNNRYAVQTGLNIHHTAGKFSGEQGDYKATLSMIEIPALFKLSTDWVDERNYFGQFGFRFGLPVSDKVKDGDSSMISTKGLYMALTFGLGAQLELSDNGVVLSGGLYYDNGFTSMFEVEGEKFRLKHIGVQTSVYF